ncbi:ATP-binding cassette domain-containing protein [Rhodoferax aquaticus]|uniref:ATP-binding cassette domain-containing protein n=1 Tax=Rhodoferax aquaticus TaxID=2527691 RepID=A0A515ESS7_9BURK|nr:ATP-binding cassette domain-containing protein [Rhodoferax aquaticus]QDL55714.1 ATP-binding cassette domain-containing protein [Rhodoferax aquaticus]
MALQLHIHRLATPRHTLLAHIDLVVAPGVVHTVMGPSGSGKSSLLAAVCGTLDPAVQFEGSITLGDTRVDTLPTQARRIGMLFQDDLLFAHMTVLENLLFALPSGPRANRKTQAQQALVDVEMDAYAEANPATLSGGQRARVALARALLAQPRALLLDEPFSKLDANLRARMRALVFGLVAQRQIPALLVTHDTADIAHLDHLTHLTHAVTQPV